MPTPLPALPICVDRYLPGRRYERHPAAQPIDMRNARREELALDKYKLWQPGETLRVGFLDGAPELRRRVELLALTWTEHANLRLEFGDFPDPVIRISFIGAGYWSYVGTDALSVDDDEPTMTLADFTADADETKLRRAVLHEFGHALGCVHEQASPTAAIPWNLAAIYPYYEHYYSWDQATVDENVLKRYSDTTVYFTEHDPLSIMQYPVASELTLGGFAIGWNTTLSETDKVFIAAMYPHTS